MTQEEWYERERNSWLDTYNHFYKAFNADNKVWDELWRHFNIYVWKANKKYAISQYLQWEYLVPHLKEYDITYYSGIDRFLEEWKDAVHGALKSVYDEDDNTNA